MSEKSFPVKTLLFVSLAVNLLAAGAVAGALFAGVRLAPSTQSAVVERMPAPRAFMAALPVEVREKLRPELVQSWAQSRDQRLAAAQARRDAFDAAAAEPYDAARVKAAFARLRAADQAAIGVFHDTFADAFASLTPQERHAALESLRNAAPAQRIGPGERRMRRWRERQEN